MLGSDVRGFHGCWLGYLARFLGLILVGMNCLYLAYVY